MSVHMNVHSTTGVTVAKADGDTCHWLELKIESGDEGKQCFEMTLFFEPGKVKLRNAIYKALRKASKDHGKEVE